MSPSPGNGLPPGWELVDGHLHREFTFDDFAGAFSFMTKVAVEAERLDHHPDWSNSWNRVTIDLVSHDAGTVTARDVALAEAINAIGSMPQVDAS
ncbi:MAG: 4a-hydroxytetrahydrobiopterin dehydratase [Aquihabitans sp.]